MVVGLSSVIVITSPDIEVVNVVVASDVLTTVVGTRTVESDTWVTVGPVTVVGIVVGTVSVVRSVVRSVVGTYTVGPGTTCVARYDVVIVKVSIMVVGTIVVLQEVTVTVSPRSVVVIG